MRWSRLSEDLRTSYITIPPTSLSLRSRAVSARKSRATGEGAIVGYDHECGDKVEHNDYLTYIGLASIIDCIQTLGVRFLMLDALKEVEEVGGYRESSST